LRLITVSIIAVGAGSVAVAARRQCSGNRRYRHGERDKCCQQDATDSHALETFVPLILHSEATSQLISVLTIGKRCRVVRV
jgi:hypothetical protein